MATQFNPRETASESVCINAPERQVLRTLQTLQTATENPEVRANSDESAPQLVHLFSCIQARYG
jgi:hypothetical protein